MPFYLGSPVPLSYPSTDASGNPQNTSPVTVTVTMPDQTTASPTVTNPGIGLYTATFFSTQAGHHEVTWTAGGAYPGQLTDSFDVRPAAETSLLSLAECKRALRLPAGDSDEDDFVTEFSRAVTDVVEWWCGPVNIQTVVEELTAGGVKVMLSKPPILQLVPWAAVPSQFASDTNRAVPVPPSPMFPVMVFGVTYPMAQLYADPRKGKVSHTAGLPFYYGPYLWQYQAGRPVIPECIRSGFKAILRHIYGMERGGQGSGALGAGDEETTLTPTGYAVPNRALELMASEQLGGGAAIA